MLVHGHGMEGPPTQPKRAVTARILSRSMLTPHVAAGYSKALAPLTVVREPAEEKKYTSRIQKGGAMLNEMRQLVQLWHDGPEAELRAELIRKNELNRATRARLNDVLTRIFLPRFVHGPRVPNAWRLLVPLERLGASGSMVRPLYFWVTALAEPLVYDCCVEYLARRRELQLVAIEVAEVAAWVGSKGSGWSETVTIKVTRALLAALRDFGVLEGRAKKQLGPHVCRWRHSRIWRFVCIMKKALHRERCWITRIGCCSR